nr:immunoglobulin heavy chain junction region [Macaca mulatta]MOX59321.1 immunoglobulin heavy chain junction region [Macaca mulatta]MOX60354.1 immunoglobulin heavy chain junction region [Macaca mulatta]MOX60753.1 immunoglobulin heavy chain junction region [Macaca mulatta]MOX62320.1 immunoglobulin heavy chain junction region [Macaca mulatta]
CARGDFGNGVDYW